MPLLDITLPGNTLFYIIFAIVIGFIVLLANASELKKSIASNQQKVFDSEIKMKEQQLVFEKKEAEYKFHMQELATAEFEKFKKDELKRYIEIIEKGAIESASSLLQTWKIDNEEIIRRDAINRSYTVNLGKITEHLIPFHKDFKFNPRDARFIGSPVDLLIFDGLSENKDIIKIYFGEVKTGTSKLTPIEKKIKFSVENKLIEWLLINPATL